MKLCGTGNCSAFVFYHHDSYLSESHCCLQELKALPVTFPKHLIQAGVLFSSVAVPSFPCVSWEDAQSCTDLYSIEKGPLLHAAGRPWRMQMVRGNTANPS